MKGHKAAKALIEIFKAVADACDGVFDQASIQDIVAAYLEALEEPEIKELYQLLIDRTPLRR